MAKIALKCQRLLFFDLFIKIYFLTQATNRLELKINISSSILNKKSHKNLLKLYKIRQIKENFFLIH